MKPDIVYHGTRCPRDLIQERGLVFDREFILERAHSFADLIGIRFEIWKEAEPYYRYLGEGPRLIGSIDPGKRRAGIHVTQDYLNAVSYSLGNPEILYEMFDSMYHFKYPRRYGDPFFYEKGEAVYNEIKKIGSRQVITIDNTHPEIQADKGINQTTKSGKVPVDAILKLEYILEDDRRNHLNSRMISDKEEYLY